LALPRVPAQTCTAGTVFPVTESQCREQKLGERAAVSFALWLHLDFELRASLLLGSPVSLPKPSSGPLHNSHGSLSGIDGGGVWTFEPRILFLELSGARGF
jgi:hypothetical protein